MKTEPGDQLSAEDGSSVQNKGLSRLFPEPERIGGFPPGAVALPGYKADEKSMEATRRRWNLLVNGEPSAPPGAPDLIELCALSVGLHPMFADPAWIRTVAIPHIEGRGMGSESLCDLVPARIHPEVASFTPERLDHWENERLKQMEINDKKVSTLAALKAFCRRYHVAELSVTEEPDLRPEDGFIRKIRGGRSGSANPVRTSDFVHWARLQRWELPAGWGSLSGSGIAGRADQNKTEGIEGQPARFDLGDASPYPDDLGALVAAWRRFWKDVSDTDRTAWPRNDAVVNWLKARGLSDNLAKAGTTLIKPRWARDVGRPPKDQ